jgi:hypothetical protein
MNKRRLATSALLSLVTLGLSSSTAAAGTEANKFVAVLSVSPSGAIVVTVRNPEPSAACPQLQLPTGEKDRLYGMLLAAKAANQPVTISYGSDCRVTGVALP